MHFILFNSNRTVAYLQTTPGPLFHSIVFYSLTFSSVLHATSGLLLPFYSSILLYSVLFYSPYVLQMDLTSILFHSILLYFNNLSIAYKIFHSILFQQNGGISPNYTWATYLFYHILFYSILFYNFYSISFYSIHHTTN